jgi:integrase
MGIHKGDGTFKVRDGKIYVHGTINGKFYRKSTKKEANEKNLKWASRQSPLKILAEILGISETQETEQADLEIFGLTVLGLTTKGVTDKHRKDVYRTFDKHILPYFKGVEIQKIKPIDLVNYLEILKTKQSHTRVKFAKNTFSMIMDYAVDNEIINTNPFNSPTVKRVKLKWTPKKEVYTTEEVAKIMQASRGWLKVFLDLSFKYGLRPGEAQVLKWEDFDLDHGVLHLQRVSNNDNVIVEFPEKQEGENKNHRRKIPLFDSTIALLKMYYELRPHDEWLFVNKDSKPFDTSASIVSYHFKPLLKKIGIKYKTLYATRRSHASIMNFAGDNLEKIQEVMGHTKGSAVTEKHYITADILTLKDIEAQAKRSEALFNTMIQSSNVPEE